MSGSAGSGISTWLVRRWVPFRLFVLFSEDGTLWLGMNRRTCHFVPKARPAPGGRKNRLGNTELVIKISKGHLEIDLRRVSDRLRRRIERGAHTGLTRELNLLTNAMHICVARSAKRNQVWL